MAKAENAQKSVKSGAPSPEGIAHAAKEAAPRGPAPVHLWDPPHQGEIDMEIRRDGTWFYQGTPINRPKMVRLFSTILRKDDDGYVLVTPVEKVGIRVEDAPFVAVDVAAAGTGLQQTLTFTTNVGDAAAAGPDHPIRVETDPKTGEPAPYVLIRANLEALIDRKTFYRMIELGAQEIRNGENWFGLWSGGSFFPVMRSEDLE